MSVVTKILVPTNFSKASEAALQYAYRLAAESKASLVVLHTVENPYPIGGEFFEWFERQARKNLDAVLTPEEQTRYRVQLVLLGGAAADEIARYLSEHRDIDLVVMATRDHKGMAGLMMGSVAQKTVRAARCPVIVVRYPECASGVVGAA